MKKIIYFVLGLMVLLNLFLIGNIILDKYEIEPVEIIMADSPKEVIEENTEEPSEKTIKPMEELSEPIEEVVANIREPKELSISLVGDLLMDGSVRGQINQNGYDYPWEFVAEYFQEDDITIGNLETSITKGGSIWPDKQYNFRSDPENLEAMKKAGIDVVSLANNHTLDYGYDGLLDTLNYIDKSGIYSVGAGKDYNDAFKETIIEKNGYRVGILGFSRVVPDVGWWATKNRPGLAGAYDGQLNAALKKVEEVKEEVDILILSIHWGTELQITPRDHDVLAAKRLIDAGADVIMGHHPHVLQGIEIYNGKPIFYSLGNFVFSSKNKLTAQTIIGQVNYVNGEIESLKILPHKIVAGRPTPYNEDEKIINIEYINELSQKWGVKFDHKGILKMK